jgi:transposase-like protein
MTKDDVLFGYRQWLVAEAARTSVSAACRTFGVHRSTYYACKRQVDRHGLEMLRPRERRRPQMLNALAKMIEERIVSFLDRPSRARAQARLLRARPGEVGRHRRLPQRCVEGSLPPRAEHPSQAPWADRWLRSAL